MRVFYKNVLGAPRFGIMNKYPLFLSYGSLFLNKLPEQ